MSELCKLINRLKRAISQKKPYIKTIRYPRLLIIYLKELDEVIGMEDVKTSVAKQTSHLITMKERKLKNPNIKEDDVMLHTLLLGPPGVGKTLIGKTLAKIWYCLGYIGGSGYKQPQKSKNILNGMFGDQNTTDESTQAALIYFLIILAVIFITIISLAWSMYNKIGGTWTVILSIIFIILVIIFILTIYYSNQENQPVQNIGDNRNINNINTNINRPPGNVPVNTNEQITDDEPEEAMTPEMMPSDDEIITVVSRVDFIDKFVGWTDKKTLKLLNDNRGKTLFVDEAYSLINGPSDEFGMEALTTLNLFMSQYPRDIVIIFGGYKDALALGPFAVQEGLERRFMWQFECVGYTPRELFEIYKLQLKRSGWGLTNERETLQIFLDNEGAFPKFGGDTERAAFFAKIEHSSDYIDDNSNMDITKLSPRHVLLGIQTLKRNNMNKTDVKSTNPMLNMMKMLKEGNKNKESEDFDIFNYFSQSRKATH